MDYMDDWHNTAHVSEKILENFIDIPFYPWSDFVRAQSDFFSAPGPQPQLICIKAVLVLLGAIFMLAAV